MRITVGNVLIVLGIGGYLVLGPGKSLNTDWILHQVDRAKPFLETVKSYIPYLKDKGSIAPVPTEQSSEVPLAPPAEPAPTEPTASVPDGTSVEKPAEVPAPAVTKPAATAPRRSARKRRSKRRVKSAAKTAVPTQKSAPPAKAPAPSQQGAQADLADLMGTYVSLELKTGREVRGILQGKTATEYTVELPGLGPFTYPIEKVNSIKPAE